MSKPRSGAPKRVAAGLIASALAVTGLAFAPSAGATASVTTERFNGDTRWDTAKLISQDEAFAAPKSVIVAGGGNNRFPDSLAASVHAGTTGQTPIVLTETAQLTKQASDALTALKAKGVSTATVVGGTVAVSDATVNAIKALGLTVTRIAGTGDSADRYGTAAAVATAANAAKATGTINGVKAAFIATGLNFPDAIAAAPAAYAGRIPVLLVNSDVPAVTQKAITDLGIKKAYILGGTNAVSEAVATKIAAATGSANTRLEGTVATGQDRFGTAAVIADFEVANLGFVPTAAILANGTDAKGGLDALASGPLGGELKAPVLLTASLPKATRDWLDAHSNTISKIYASGGTGVIDAQTLADAVTAAQAVSNDTNQAFSVTPSDAASRTVSVPATALANRGARQYTVATGSATQVDIQLYPAQNVKAGTDGTVTFADTDSNNIADPGTPASEITVVNGVGNAGARANNVTPVSGQVTFTINSAVAESVVPVVYTDSTPAPAGNNGLDLVAPATANASPKAPTEAFGIGGVTTWIPAEAAAFSNVGAGEVIAVYASDQAYSIDTSGDGVADTLVKWSTGDTFASDNDDVVDAAEQAISQAQFAAWISAGDKVGAITGYNPGSVHHDLQGDFPAAPTGVAAALNSTTGVVTVTFTKPSNLISNVAANNEAYQLQRATVSTAGVVGAYANVGAAITGAATASFTDTPGPGSFSYRVVANGTDGTNAVANSVANVSAPAAVTVGTAADTTLPGVASVTASNNNATATLDAGDQVAITFTEKVTLAADASFTLMDGDGSVGTLSRGGNATMSLNSAGTTAFITLTGLPVPEAAGGTLGLNPATTNMVVNSSGVADVAGNQLAEIGVTSIVADVSDNTIVVTFNSPVDPATVTASDFTVPGTVTLGAITPSAGNTVFTVAATGQVVGNTITLKANSVTGAFGGNGPATPATTASVA